MSKEPLYGISDYLKIEKIGEGTYGVVYKGKNRKTGQIVAIKQIKPDFEKNGIPPTAIREISILKGLRHPNIVSIEDIILEDNRFFLIFEFLSMDLKNYIDNMKSKTYMDSTLIKSYMYQINKAILFCHQRRILHRDLKPSNLLITRNGTIKLADFGLSRAFGVPLRVYTHEVATLWYRAPEILLGSPLYSCPIDVWSMGCIFAEMSTKCPLFPGDSEIDQLFKIFRILKTPTEELWPGVSKLPDYKETFPKWTLSTLKAQLRNMDNDAVNLLNQMMVYDPAKRISAKNIAVHPYFVKVDISVKPVFNSQ